MSGRLNKIHKSESVDEEYMSDQEYQYEDAEAEHDEVYVDLQADRSGMFSSQQRPAQVFEARPSKRHIQSTSQPPDLGGNESLETPVEGEGYSQTSFLEHGTAQGGEVRQSQLLQSDQDASVVEEAKHPKRVNQKRVSLLASGLNQSQSISQTKRKSDSQSAKRASQILAISNADMEKSKSGLDVATKKSVGSFFSSHRERNENKLGQRPNFYNTTKLEGKEFITELINQQEDRYHKKFAFERGQYHQCIPNPLNANQMITVQMVMRVLKGQNVQPSANKNESQIDQKLGSAPFSEQRATDQSNFQRYNLVPPTEEDDDEMGGGEGENADEKEHEDVSNRGPQRRSVQDVGQEVPGFQKIISKYGYGGADEQELYKEASLDEKPDRIEGSRPSHYANISKETQQNQSDLAYQDCEEFAVIAFWNLDRDEDEKLSDDQFKCQRFFIVPSPMKRTIQNCEGTKLHQILYLSPNSDNKDVFLFFKSQSSPLFSAGDDLDEVTDDSWKEEKLQVAFLNLSPSVGELSNMTESRNLFNHCIDVKAIKENNILGEFVMRMNRTEFDDQKQLPNPKVLYLDPFSQTKTIVFTAFLREKFWSKDYEGGDNQVSESWYPTIYFYDLDQHRVVWEIFGAEQLIALDKHKRVVVLTNEYWTDDSHKKKIQEEDEEDQQDFNQEDNEEEGFSRHEKFDNYIWRINWNTSCDPDELVTRDKYVPAVQATNAYRLTFGKNKGLEITEAKCKLVEAYSHNFGTRATLLYKNLGSFTFAMNKAKSLAIASEWYAKIEKLEFRADLTFNKFVKHAHQNRSMSKQNNTVSGKGQDEDGRKVKVNIDMDDYSWSHWKGFYETDVEMFNLIIEDLRFIPQPHGRERFQTQTSSNDGALPEIVISDGYIGDKINDMQNNDIQNMARNQGRKQKKTKDQEATIGWRKVNFLLTEPYKQYERPKYFSGMIDPLLTQIKGTWGYERDQEGKNLFEFRLAEDVKARLNLTVDKRPYYEAMKVQIDFTTMRIKNQQGMGDSIEEFYSRDCVDTADLRYFILQPDVTAIRLSQADLRIQAKLKSIGEEDQNSNGQGVIRSSLFLYNVSDEKTYGKGKPETYKKKLKIVAEPQERTQVEFFLNQSFLRTQENKESQLWVVNPPIIDADGRFFCSIIYEEYGTDELCLNFITSQFTERNVGSQTFNQDDDDDDKVDVLDYPQQPVPQSWIVDYPILAYKTFNPQNKEIAIIHMALNIPQRVINLGEWEFVCFVNHTQMVEQKLFDKTKETNCDIMFLVRRNKKVRLMSFKTNPWLGLDDKPSQADPDIYKQAIFLFSGEIPTFPHEDKSDEKILIKRYSRRFNNDKIQSAQLIGKQKGSYQQCMIIMQFNDCIVQTSLNKRIFKVICEPAAMLRRHMVRGYNEKIFYAESAGNAEKIYQIEFHPLLSNEISTKEIWQLAGSWLVALEPDAENIHNDMEDDVPQSLFVMDDAQKIYWIKNEDAVRFVTTKVIDFSHHEKLAEINSLRDNDWAHVHVTDETLSFGETTYNLSNNLSMDITVPKHFFGQAKDEKLTQNLAGSIHKSASQKFQEDDDNDDKDQNANNDDDDDDEDEDESRQHEKSSWITQSVQSMSMTSNMITQCQRNHREFCFVVKPAPGSRRINIVGFQQLHEIDQMLFVSNSHVLLKFKGDKAVTLLSNGCVMQQENRIQQYIEANSRVVGESQIFRGHKTVLFEQIYGEEADKKRHIALNFNQDGSAKKVGIFNQFKEDMTVQVKKLLPLGSLPRTLTGTVPRTISSTIKNITQMAVKAATAAKGEEQQEQKTKQKKLIRYAKEFFINEKGEVLKMAAIITRDEGVLQLLESDPFLNNQNAEKTAGPKGRKKQRTRTRNTFISVFKVNNTETKANEVKEESEQVEEKCQFKVIVFHCKDKEHQKQMVKNTQYCYVGNYLCYRNRDQKIVWITEVKKEFERPIPINDLDTEQPALNGQLGIENSMISAFQSKMLSIHLLANQLGDIEHIQMTEVPKGYFTTIKSRIKEGMLFYNNILQVTVRSHGMIYDLDSLREVDSIESIDQFQDPDTSINTGFIMSTSTSEDWEGTVITKRAQLFTNEHCNLLFSKNQVRQKDKPTKYKISGMLFRSFTEMDLKQLDNIAESIQNRTKIDKIDISAMLSTYEGHTIFSLFFDRIEVYEQILSQLQDYEFEDEEDINGQDCESSLLRRLYRVLNLPTDDLLHFKAKGNNTRQYKDLEFQDNEGANTEDTCLERLADWLRDFFGIVVIENANSDKGFKNIMKKSLHFKSTRFRECLMQIAMLCFENSTKDFVDSLGDIEILIASMSPTIVEFFENGFNETRFTKKIKNLDWQIGSTLEVVPRMTSIVTQKKVNQCILNGKTAEANEKIQNRTVSAKMLQIGWVFQDPEGNRDIGFRELVIALSRAPHESLFSTELVIILVSHFIQRYYKVIRNYVFLPWFVYFITTVVYISNFSVDGYQALSDDEKIIEGIMRLVIFVLMLYFLFFEVVSFIRDGYKYWESFHNKVDIFSFLLNIYLIYATVWYHPSNNDRSTVRIFAAIAVILMWIKFQYWLRLFSQTSFYVRLIMDTIYDIRWFLIFFVLVLITFANALYILNQRRDGEIFQNFFSINILDAIFNQYMMSLGEFDMDNFQMRGNDKFVWVLFALSTFITQITFLNMLIAIMGDTFDRVFEVKEQSGLREKIDILADYVILVGRESKANRTKHRFIFAISPTTTSTDESGIWEGTVTAIKKTIADSTQQIKQTMGKRMNTLSIELASSTTFNQQLKEQIGELHVSQDKQTQRLIQLDDRITEMQEEQKRQQIQMQEELKRQQVQSMKDFEACMSRLLSESKY